MFKNKIVVQRLKIERRYRQYLESRVGSLITLQELTEDKRMSVQIR